MIIYINKKKIKIIKIKNKNKKRQNATTGKREEKFLENMLD